MEAKENTNTEGVQLDLSEAVEAAANDSGDTIVMFAWGASEAEAAVSVRRAIEDVAERNDTVRCAIEDTSKRYDMEVGQDLFDQLTEEIVCGVYDHRLGTLGDARIWWGVADDREHLDKVIEGAVGSATDSVVVDNLAAFGASVGAVQKRLDNLLSKDVPIRLVDTDTTIAPSDRALIGNILRALDVTGPELMRATERRDVERWVSSRELECKGGRPPLGYMYNDDGERVPADNFDEVRATLSAAADPSSDLSRRQAAKRLNTSLRTVSRAIDERASMYGLEEDDE